MRSILVFFLAFSFGICLSAGAQNFSAPLERPVVWQKEAPLQWKNFQGKADPLDVVHAAVTYAGIEIKVERIEPISGVITFRAKAIFDQGLSWVNPARKDARVLAHEQVHFDITEVYARRLQRKLNSLKLTQRDKKMIKKLHQVYTQTQLDFQETYDDETLHGLRPGKQQEWRRKIDQYLRKSETYLFTARKKLHFPFAYPSFLWKGTTEKFFADHSPANFT